MVRGDTMFVGRQPLPALEAWLAQNRARLMKPGTVGEIQIWHDHDCPYPQGGDCTCVLGPEIRIAGEVPEAN
jgi:hypothetical protein